MTFENLAFSIKYYNPLKRKTSLKIYSPANRTVYFCPRLFGQPPF
jgi:hypothetical protein